MIHHISTDELVQLQGADGLVLQGCGGDPAEWLEGINKAFTVAGILQNDNAFEDIHVFEHDGLTNILIDIGSVDLDVGKLAAWRMETYPVYGGEWLGDYLTAEFASELEEPEVEAFALIKPKENRLFSEANELADDYAKRGAGRDSTTETRGVQNYNEAYEAREDDETYKPMTKPITAYIENAHDSSIGGFTIPLPATAEELQSFLEGAEITGWQDLSVLEIESDIGGLADSLHVIIAEGMTPTTLDELNYLAAKLTELDANTADGIDIFAANIEAGRNCGSIADMINLTFRENLGCFDVLPAFSPGMYGDFLVDTYYGFEHEEILNRLETSDDEQERAFAKYVMELGKHIDTASLGLAAAAEQNGVFTDVGLLMGGDGLQKLYRSSHDIPAEHRLLTKQGEELPYVMEIEGTNIAEAIIKLHAVGLKSMEFAADNVKMFFESYNRLTEEYGKEQGTPAGQFLILQPALDLCVVPASEIYKRGSDTSKGALEMISRAVERDDANFKVYAACIIDKENVTGNIVEIDPKALHAHITQHAAMPDRVDAVHDDGTKKSYNLLEWAEMLQKQKDNSAGIYSLHYPDEGLKKAVGDYVSFRGAFCMISENDTFSAHLPKISNMSAKMTENHPGMIRIANEAAKEILARGDADIYRLKEDGQTIKLSPIEAARSLCFAEHRALAIKHDDAAGLEKWAARKVSKIVRKMELEAARNPERENNKKHRGEEL